MRDRDRQRAAAARREIRGDAVLPPPRAWLIPAVAAAAAFLLYLVPGLAGAYGSFIDEHYYVACARRLAWGYVDHPPLAPFLLRMAVAIFGDSLAVLRVIAALAGAATVLGAGLLAARLGGNGWGQGLAAAAMIAVPVAQVLFGFYSMNALEPLLWLALCWLAIEIALGAPRAMWLAFGAAAAVALLNKHTAITFVLALGAGMLGTSARRRLASPWPWAGAVLAVILLAPHLAWQVRHGWPSLEFYRNAALLKNQPIGPLEVLAQQVLFVGPGTLPIWIAGLVYLWRAHGGALRHLALAYGLLLAALMASGQSRPDRIVGMYPLLLAAGGAALAAASAARPWIRVAAPVWLGLWFALLLPIGTPVLPPDLTGRYAQALGVVPQLERGEGKRSRLPQWFADRLDWEAFVRDVAEVRDALPAADRERVMFFAPSYGQAGALEWLGAERALVPVFSTHNSYFMWGPPPAEPEIAIVIGNSRGALTQIFEDVRLARVHECGDCMPWRNGMPIWVARQPKVRLADRWAEWKHFE